MRKILSKTNIQSTLFAVFFAAAGNTLYAQQKINDGTVPNTVINTDAIQEYQTNNKGLLLPRISLTSTSSPAPLSAHAEGMYVYNTASNSNVTPGPYYNNGAKWVPVAPSPQLITITSGGRNFNQAYMISATKAVEIKVSVQISCNLSLLGGQGGEIILEYSADGSTGWTFAGEVTASNTAALAVSISTTQRSGAQISGTLPAGYYWRLRTNNVIGSPAYTFLGGVEVIY